MNDVLVHQLQRQHLRYCHHGFSTFIIICTIKLSSAVMMGGAYDRGGALSVGQLGHMICCSGQ